MFTKPKIDPWRVIGKTVPGASHQRVGLPNQDAFQCFSEESGLPIILAVSDGHGSAKCFRSDQGSRLAVETAVQVMQEFLKNLQNEPNPSLIKRTAEERMPHELVRKWIVAVERELQQNPFTEEELKAVEEKDGAAARQKVTDKPVLAYGATLLIAVVSEKFILYFQLGDGDILNVSKTGEVTRPLPKDEKLFANETTSLCSGNSWTEFRTGFQPVDENSPVMILISTDGYANSFPEDAGFLKVGSDLLEIARTEGFDTIDENLEPWLTEATQVGSGDDITLGIICNTTVLGTSESDPKNQKKSFISKFITIRKN